MFQEHTDGFSDKGNPGGALGRLECPGILSWAVRLRSGQRLGWGFAEFKTSPVEGSASLIPALSQDRQEELLLFPSSSSVLLPAHFRRSFFNYDIYFSILA